MPRKKKDLTKKEENVELIEKEVGIEEKESYVPKVVEEKENKQVLWLFFWVIVVFAAFLIPYFYAQSLKHFDYGQISFISENYPGNLKIYHGQFPAFNAPNITYNVFLRYDPRKNDVPTKGTFSSFKYGGYISISPTVDECRGEVSRALTDLGAFIKRGVGVTKIDVATNNEEVSTQMQRVFVNCSTNKDRTVVVIERGASAVIQDENNKFCYTILIKDCEDIKPIEKFIVKTVSDFKENK